MAKKTTQDEQQPYLHDEHAEREINRLNERTQREAENLLHVYSSVTGFSIENIEQLNDVLEDPQAHYKARYFQANQHELGSLTKLNLDVGSLIKLPEGFSEVQRIAARLKPLSEKQWTIEGNKLQLTPEEQQKIREKVYCVASSEDERRRLAIAQGLIEAFKEVEKEIQLQFKQGQAKQIIDEKSYLRNSLPYQLKLMNTSTGLTIVANPNWVKDGFKGVNGLPGYIPTDREVKQAQRKDLGEKHVMWRRTVIGGKEKLFYQLVSEYKEQPGDEFVKFCNALGEDWGTTIDLTKARVRNETFYQVLK